MTTQTEQCEHAQANMTTTQIGDINMTAYEHARLPRLPLLPGCLTA